MSKMFTPAQDKRKFVSILSSTGRFHMQVPEGTEGSVQRVYETSDSKTGTKNELVFEKIYARIKTISFEEGDYGEQLLITVQGEEGEVTIATNSGNSFGVDIMKKLPNVDLAQPVEFAPYAFVNDRGKKVQGVNLYQNGMKLADFFQQKDGDKWVSFHGFPEKKKEYSEMKTRDWQSYFNEVTEFLVNYTSEKICPEVNNAPQEKKEATDEISPDSIPF